MIIQLNSIFSIGSFTGTYDKLPVGTYRLRQNPKTDEYYLVLTEDFILPNKLYGDFKIVDRILNTFKTQDKNLACIFCGTKGSGKTATAKKICIESKMPVIILDAAYDDVELISFLSSPELGSCIILIDEYEKLYCEKNVNEEIMLQLLDGACNSHHLFILTVNAVHRLNSNLINRPSRIFYRKMYGGISLELAEEIIDCELIHKRWKKEMLDVLDKFSEITFDITMSLIKEVNLYDESPLECAKLMNFCPDPIYVEIEQIFEDGTNRKSGTTSLFDNPANIELCTYDSAKTDSTYDWMCYSYEDLKRINPTTWEINDGKYRFILTRISKFKLLF